LTRLEPVINFISLESKEYLNAPLSLTMEAWGTRGKSAIALLDFATGGYVRQLKTVFVVARLDLAAGRDVR
jgi:hypothetical protein